SAPILGRSNIGGRVRKSSSVFYPRDRAQATLSRTALTKQTSPVDYTPHSTIRDPLEGALESTILPVLLLRRAAMRYVGLILTSCCMFSCFFTRPDRNNLFDTPASQSTADTMLDRHVQVILNSKNGLGVCEGYQTLFRKIGPDGLANLRTHQNDGIALQAA